MTDPSLLEAAARNNLSANETPPLIFSLPSFIAHHFGTPEALRLSALGHSPLAATRALQAVCRDHPAPTLLPCIEGLRRLDALSTPLSPILFDLTHTQAKAVFPLAPRLAFAASIGLFDLASRQKNLRRRTEDIGFTLLDFAEQHDLVPAHRRALRRLGRWAQRRFQEDLNHRVGVLRSRAHRLLQRAPR